MGIDRVVVVGSSIGGVRSAQALRANGFVGGITVVGAEDELPYDKPPLSKRLLAGGTSPEEIRLVADGDLPDEGIELRLGTAAAFLDVKRRQVGLIDGAVLDYDAVIIATGVRPRTVGGDSGSLVHTVRDLADVSSLRRALSGGGPLVVIGGGFIGAEIASTAASLGVRSTIVEAMPAPFSRVLGVEVGAIVDDLHRAHGVEVIAGSGVLGVERRGTDQVVVRMDNGHDLVAGTVVAGIGCVPNIEWLASSGLRTDDGLTTDEYCRVEDAPGVHAIGDVARWFDVRTGTHRRVEHWTHAFQQAQLVAHNITHPQDLQAHVKAPYFWSDQHNVKIQMVGRRGVDDDVEILQCDTPAGKRTVALYSNSGTCTGSVVFGWPQLVPRLRRAWEGWDDVDDVRRLVLEASS